MVNNTITTSAVCSYQWQPKRPVEIGAIIGECRYESPLASGIVLAKPIIFLLQSSILQFPDNVIPEGVTINNGDAAPEYIAIIRDQQLHQCKINLQPGTSYQFSIGCLDYTPAVGNESFYSSFIVYWKYV